MKKYIYIIFTTLAIVSCSVDEFLDVKPTGVVIPQTVQDFESLLNKPTPSDNEDYWSNLDYMDPDVLLDQTLFDQTSQGNLDKRRAYLWEENIFTAEDDDPDWNRGYRKIYVYNSIIKDIDAASLNGLSESDRIRVKGEAYAQRAMEYFLLANEYGPAYSTANRDMASIPMPLTPNINAQLSKETVGVVFDQILSDLNEANSLLSNRPAVVENANFRPGSASVKALLAMVSLHRGEFTEANSYATQVLSERNFLYDYTTIDNNTPGDAWSGVNESDFTFTAYKDESVIWNRISKRSFAYPYNGNLFASDLLALFDQANDQRFVLFSSDKASSFSGPTIDVAPNVAYASINRPAQVGLTVANILLVKAEASIRDNDKASAIEALNTLLVKRIKNYTLITDADFTNNTAVLNRIKEERRKELIGTGYYPVDLKRYHALGEIIPTFTRTISGQTYTLEPGSSRYIVAVPPKVSALNPNL